MFLLIGAGTVYDQRSPPMSPNVISTRRLSARRLAAERLPRRRQLRPAKVEGAQGTHGEQPSVHAVRTAVRQHGSTAVRQRGLHRRHLPHLPRHRSHPQGKLYVCLSMGLCLVICCLILYFLFPRTVVLVPVFVQSVTVYFTPEAVSLEVTNLVNISNENFFPVQIVELDIQGLILKTIMGKSKQCNVTRLDARSQLLNLLPVESHPPPHSVPGAADYDAGVIPVSQRAVLHEHLRVHRLWQQLHRSTPACLTAQESFPKCVFCLDIGSSGRELLDEYGWRAVGVVKSACSCVVMGLHPFAREAPRLLTAWFLGL
ncbi:transmembrane protein 106A isoform X1 [Gadus macrocephalus]|uniref:transmembrane protein 106A isoform X1 n=2 Tax=Gadus macrocephalus TaxID=80720 RepID=UPI0028CBA0C2|nr:transmembrane protein 106A isoform X1 [Gadus macrocephalus]